MSDDFEEISSRMPDMDAVLLQRIAAKKGETINHVPGNVDPYKLMLQRKENKLTEPLPIQKWPDEEVKALEDYCNRMGIVGFNCGKMSPMAALSMLKQQFGDYIGIPLEERVPEGYEKCGTLSSNGPNYPYTKNTNTRQILHG